MISFLNQGLRTYHYLSRNGIETSAVAASEQEGDSQGQQSAEYKLENQAKAMEADIQGIIFHNPLTANPLHF